MTAIGNFHQLRDATYGRGTGEAMIQRGAIVAVVGGNKTAGTTVMAAELVGQALAAEGAILLTGSQPMPGPQIKRAAMRGAARSGRPEDVGGRLIGILPKGEVPVFKTNPETQRLIQTKFSSGERNPVTGMTADVMLVFEGGVGTLAELGFALVAQRPVFFVGSVDALGRTFDHDAKALRDLLTEGLEQFPEICERQTIADDILAVTETHLKSAIAAAALPARTFAVDEVINTGNKWARDLVKRAITAIAPENLRSASGFPGLPGVLDKAVFEAWLSTMA